MADETTTIATALTEPGTAQGGQAQPPAQPGNTASTAQDKTPALDLEKELQRIRSQAGREAAAARQAAEAAQREAAALRAQMREQRLSQMDAAERPAFERDEALQYAQHLQQQLVAAQDAAQRERDIAEIVSETGAPREVLDEAQNLHDAWRRAAKWQKENATTQTERRAAELAERRAANAVDLGGGKPNTPADRVAEDFDKAMRSGDAIAYARLLRESRRQRKD